MATGFWLLDHPNPNGAFYHSSRITCQHGVKPSDLPHIIVVHTAESLPDFVGDDTSGEALCRYASSTDRSVSWHSTVDADSTIPMLPDSYVGAHVVNYNRCSVGVEISTKAHLWVEAATKYPAWYAAIMGNVANQVAWWCKTHNIQPVYLTKAEVDQGKRGVISHARLDPTRRTDPGAAFAWDRLLADVQARLTPGGYLDRPTWPDWAATSIQKAIDRGVMVGDGKLWTPEKTVTRAELAVVLDRLGLLNV